MLRSALASPGLVQTWQSRVITVADLTAGASCEVDLGPGPRDSTPMTCWVKTLTSTMVSGPTTSVTVQVGETALANSYMAGSEELVGAAGVRNCSRGVLLSATRVGDPIRLTVTADGDCADITSLNLIIGINYIPVT